MSKRLSDDEKRVFTDQISLLKNENERLRDSVEELIVRLMQDIERLKTENEELRAKVWKALAPYMASEDVGYDEDEMAHLCENVLPALWSALLTEESD